MAWRSSHNDDNKIDIEPSVTYNVDVGTYTGPDLIGYAVTQQIQRQKFAYVGMTKAAAATCVSDMYTTYGTEGVTAVAQHMGAGYYNVTVTIHKVTASQSAIT